MPNDHTVPQSYLRRFSTRRKGTGYIVARPVEDFETVFHTNVRNIASENGFYTLSSEDGEDDRALEDLLGKVESLATPAFAAVLDDPVYAFANDWPLGDELRESLAWWMAAQVLRTTRQRSRLAHLLDTSDELDAPRPLSTVAARDAHVLYVVHQLGHLAYVLADRPWGIGVSDTCLLTSDVPVVVLNAQDDADQQLAVAEHDVLLALDPHRFLFLPGPALVAEDRHKWVDHRLHFPGGLGMALCSMVRDAADRHVFHHPTHLPPMLDYIAASDHPRLAKPWLGQDPAKSPAAHLSYGTLPWDQTIERKWTDADHSAGPPRKKREG